VYKPKFIITNKILKNIGLIEASREVIENAPLVPYYEKQFASDALARTIHHGTHIEGVGLDTLDQVKRVLEGEEVIAHERDVQEVINYRNVMRLLDDLSAKRGDYAEEDFKEIHKETVNKIIPDEKVGVFRKTQVVIKEEGSGQVILKPPPPVEVPYLLADFFEWINSAEARDLHPILRAGVAHYILVAVHPFVEGNGRAVRAFSNLILMKEGYDLKRFFSLEEHFDADPGSYYEAFAQVDMQSPNIAARDMTPWIEYFTKVVAVELGKIKEKVRKLSIDTRLKGKLGQQIALTERQMKLIEYLSENHSAGMYELKSVLPMISEDTILRDINDLMDKGIIKKEGKTKASRYIIGK
jgi:Fic family protein